MNGKNLNVRYRRNAYAKTRIKVISAIIGGLAVILVILFLVIGGVLKDKVDNDRQNDATDQVDNINPETPHTTVAAVKGYGISLSGVSAAQVTDKVSQIANAGGSNINFVARDSSGNELYKSALAKSMGKQSSDYIDVGDINSRAANRGLSASAIVPVYSFGKNDDLERAAQLFYDAAICAELYREGADDVLIKLEGTKISDKNVEELVRFAEWVKDLESEAVIGITLTPEILNGEGAEVIVGKLWEKYDFLALDLTDLDLEKAQNDKGNEMQFYLLMYGMRVLLPDASGGDLSNMVSYLNGMDVDNWQTVVS